MELIVDSATQERGKSIGHGRGIDQEHPDHRLGRELRRIRRARGDTLRAVEEATGISNAYLSQLETGKITKPSPKFLYKLSAFYKVPYEDLMQYADYIAEDRAGDENKRRRLSAAALATMADLTPEEEEELMKYAEYLRSRRRQELP